MSKITLTPALPHTEAEATVPVSVQFTVRCPNCGTLYTDVHTCKPTDAGSVPAEKENKA